MSKQRFHTMTAIKSFVFKHLEDEHGHLTPDEFAEQFDLSAPDPLFVMICVCDEEFNAVELCHAANYRDRRERLIAGGESLFSPHPAVDISKAVKGWHVGGMIGRTVMIEIKPARSAVLMVLPMVPVLDEKSVVVVDRKIDSESDPLPDRPCSTCNKMFFCSCLPLADYELEKCKGCDIPFCECWDGKPDPNANVKPLTYTHEPVEPGSCLSCDGVCSCHEPFNGVAYFGDEPVELPCMGIKNGCVCSNCVPF